jgi:hypothetical protein
MSVFSNEAIQNLWARSDLKIWNDTYWMVAFELENKATVFDMMSQVEAGEHYTSCICDQHEVAAIIPDKVWAKSNERIEYRDAYGPLICITLDVPLEIEVSGYLQPAVNNLAQAGISIVPQCALIYDHILVNAADENAAVSILTELKEAALG